MIRRRRRRPEPDTRPDWRDPDMPVLYRDSDGKTGILTPFDAQMDAAMSMVEYDRNPRSHPYNWRHDTLYGKAGENDTPPAPDPAKKSQANQYGVCRFCDGTGIVRMAVYERHDFEISPVYCDTPLEVSFTVEEVACDCGTPPYRPLAPSPKR